MQKLLIGKYLGQSHIHQKNSFCKIEQFILEFIILLTTCWKTRDFTLNIKDYYRHPASVRPAILSVGQ